MDIPLDPQVFIWLPVACMTSKLRAIPIASLMAIPMGIPMGIPMVIPMGDPRSRSYRLFKLTLTFQNRLFDYVVVALQHTQGNMVLGPNRNRTVHRTQPKRDQRTKQRDQRTKRWF